ncbi:MAG: galactokinase [Spirochaetales bacterium]|nr:galactokinase [Spirochaetales bacterium]
MNDIVRLHKDEYGQEPELIASAPATINLIGEHTDYNDGQVMEFAVDRYLSVAVSRRQDQGLRFYSADLNERKRKTIPNLKFKREDRWANYQKGVIHELMQLGYKLSGMEFTISSEIPPGIGMGSSAALGVATAFAVSKLLSAELSDFQIIQSAAMAESAFMGIEQPLTDQFVSTVAQQDRIVLLDLHTLDYEYIDYDFSDVELVLTASNVPVVSPHDELRERRMKCGECVTLLKNRKLGSRLSEFTSFDLHNSMGMVPEELRRICIHVIEENERVKEAAAYLKRGQLESFGRLMNHSHESLRDNYEVSCPEIDWLVKRAWEIEGVLGSRLTGPGFGGCTISLVKRDALDEYREKIQEYDRIFGFSPEVLEIRVVDGVQSSSSLVRSVSA